MKKEESTESKLNTPDSVDHSSNEIENTLENDSSNKVPDKDSDNGINKDTDKDSKEDNKDSKDKDLDAIKEQFPGTNNLIPFTERTEEEQKEIARKGGIKSGEVRRARKTAREILQEMLQRQLSNDQIDDILGTSKNLLGEDKTAYAVINAKMIQVAAAGDTKAYNAVRDTVGDAPVQEQRIENINTPGDMALYEKVAARLEKANKKTD